MARDRDSFEVGAPGGWFARLTGSNVIVFVLLLGTAVGTVTIAWATIEHREESKARLIEMEKTHAKSLNEVAEGLKQQNEHQEVMNYILTLSQEDRQRLRLDMPRSLRERMR